MMASGQEERTRSTAEVRFSSDRHCPSSSSPIWTPFTVPFWIQGSSADRSVAQWCRQCESEVLVLLPTAHSQVR